MRKTLWTLLASTLFATSISVAKPVGPAPPAVAPKGKGRFLGAHPLVAQANSGYCYIDVPHTHDYLPDRPALYQQVGDGYVFSGDPTPFGHDGPKTVYYGHHPIPVDVNVTAGPPPPTFCFMKGPHNHEYPMPEGPGFKTKDSVIFYVGPVPPAAAAVRPQLEKALEVEYRPYVAQRPQVVVTPPPEWAGVVWVAPPPTVVVAPAAPVIVAPAAPAVIVAPPRPAVIVAPPPVIFMGGHHGKGKGWGKGHFKGGKGHWKHW